MSNMASTKGYRYVMTNKTRSTGALGALALTTMSSVIEPGTNAVYVNNILFRFMVHRTKVSWASAILVCAHEDVITAMGAETWSTGAPWIEYKDYILASTTFCFGNGSGTESPRNVDLGYSGNLLLEPNHQFALIVFIKDCENAANDYIIYDNVSYFIKEV